MPAKHDPSPLKVVDRFNKKQGRSLGGRRWNVWYWQLRCPVCGTEKVYLCNTTRGRDIRCHGDRVTIRKREWS
jgi:predicted RNA-binding Zn-ribbon protein involved in translation (DUF1610 family)